MSTQRHNTMTKFSWLGIVMLAACGPSTPMLDGSLADEVDLEYERAELTVTQDALVLRFLRPRGTGEDTVLKLSVLTAGVESRAERIYDLSEQIESLGPRGTVTRHVFEDPNETLPLIRRGRLTLTEIPGRPGRVEGTLSATFTQGHAFGAGRTVFGDFEAEVIQ